MPPISLDTSALTFPLADAIVRTPVSTTPIYAPFTILIDSAEQQPFTFTGLRGDSAKKYAPLIVRTEVTSLGRYPNSLGDYTIAGYEGRIHIERKSLSDAVSTFLGFGDGGQQRTRFTSELANLAAIECGAVVVEANFCQVWQAAPRTPNRTVEQNQASIRWQVRAWQQQFPRVQWLWCDGRREAEEEVWWWFSRWWERERKEAKKKVKESVKEQAATA
jgi:hypothetical protein